MDLTSEELSSERVLYVVWDVERYQFGYNVSLKDKPLTRRGKLRVVDSVYDPLGFAAPYTLTAKRIMQEMID